MYVCMYVCMYREGGGAPLPPPPVHEGGGAARLHNRNETQNGVAVTFGVETHCYIGRRPQGRAAASVKMIILWRVPCRVGLVQHAPLWQKGGRSPPFCHNGACCTNPTRKRYTPQDKHLLQRPLRGRSQRSYHTPREKKARRARHPKKRRRRIWKDVLG